MTQWWHTIPERIDPTIGSLGFFSFSWYGISFLLGAVLSLLVLRRSVSKNNRTLFSQEEFFDFALFLLLGAILGARIGYALLYGFSFFWQHPFALVSPFDASTGTWVGISGMSAHGGVIGIVLSIVLFSKRYGKPTLPLLDAGALAAPIAIFFGRIGNFLTGELFGRVTSVSWGMIFPRAGDGLLRHPSQLYEALGEGIFLWSFLYLLSKKKTLSGTLFVQAIGLYGGIRFFLEFFREPDPQIGIFGGMLTLGQILSLGMILGATGFLWWLRLKRNAILSRTDSTFYRIPMSQRIKIAFVSVLLLGIIAFVVWGLKTAPSAAVTSADDSGDPNAAIVYYYGRECPHCKDLEKFLEDNKIAEKVSFAKKEVWHNPKNSDEMQKRAEVCKLNKDTLGVPFVWSEGKCFVGGPDAESFFKQKAGMN